MFAPTLSFLKIKFEVHSIFIYLFIYACMLNVNLSSLLSIWQQAISKNKKQKKTSKLLKKDKQFQMAAFPLYSQET